MHLEKIACAVTASVAWPSVSHLSSGFLVQALPRKIANKNSKFDKNISKRGNVSLGRAADRDDEFPVSKGLIALFLVLVVGSSVVQIFNLFGSSAPDTEE